MWRKIWRNAAVSSIAATLPGAGPGARFPARFAREATRQTAAIGGGVWFETLTDHGQVDSADILNITASSITGTIVGRSQAAGARTAEGHVKHIFGKPAASPAAPASSPPAAVLPRP
jgi:hypothetical protein